MSSGPAYVLVHGAFHGGWCWKRVVSRLQGSSRRVFTPTLTGLADRSHLVRPDIDLSTHVHDVVNLIEWEDLGDVILCGHSYGGMVVSGVAEVVAPRIRSLVYLDALMPAPGACLWDYLSVDARKGYDDATKGNYIAPTSAASFKVNEADQSWVDEKCTPQPRDTFFERLPVTNHRSSIGAKSYVYSTGYDSPLMRRFAAEAEHAPDWRRYDVSGGHDLMIDSPDEVASILDGAANEH